MKIPQKNNFLNRKRITVYDIIIILLLAACAVVFIIGEIPSDTTGEQVEVRKNGEAIYSVMLSDIDTPIEVSADEEYNIALLIEKDGVSVIHSDCPDKICVNTGKISNVGQSIVCLPARLVVEIKASADAADDTLDGVVQ